MWKKWIHYICIGKVLRRRLGWVVFDDKKLYFLCPFYYFFRYDNFLYLCLVEVIFESEGDAVTGSSEPLQIVPGVTAPSVLLTGTTNGLLVHPQEGLSGDDLLHVVKFVLSRPVQLNWC